MQHVHLGNFSSVGNRAKRGLDIFEESDVDEFAADVPQDPKNVTLIT